MSNPQPSFKDLIKEEYKKCSQSPVYFMKKYVKIQHPMQGTIFFGLYPFQEETLQGFHDYKFNIILKSRQMGISTLVAAYSLWVMLFNKDKNILIISLKQEVAKEIITKVRFANDELPSWLKIKCAEDNRLSLKLANGSQIRATSTTKKSGVSLALSLLIIDEAALIDEAEELWTSAQPTLSTGGRAIILSTPRGVGNWFHKLWQGAEENNDGKIGKNGFHPMLLPWDLHPDRDIAWREIEGAKIGSAKKAAQEFDCDFLASGDNVVELKIIEWYKKELMTDAVEVRGVDHGLWVWKRPDYTRSYIVTADVARGDGGDYSACHVLDAVTLEQCAEYKGSLGTNDFGHFLIALSTEYNNALLVIERENVGWAAIQPALDRNYPNLFYSSTDLKYVDVQRQLRNRYDSEEKKLVPGFSTNMKTRPLIISHLEQYCREEYKNRNGVKLYSSRTFAELEVFIWKSGKAIAMDGYNDDLVMALGIGLWIRDTALKLRQEGIDLTRSTMDHTSVKKSEIMPFSTGTNASAAQAAWKMNTGRNSYGQQGDEDIKWLLG
jgi:hypothetical protein